MQSQAWWGGQAARQYLKPLAPYLGKKTDPWTDLGLTLPILLAYHLGVVFLPVQNAADLVTWQLVRLADNSLLSYAALTLGAGAVLIGVLIALGRGTQLRGKRFVGVLAEGAAYAVLMRLVASYVVGSLHLGKMAEQGLLGSFVLSLGAGFYEEVMFRVVLYGLGSWALAAATKRKSPAVTVLWALISALVFSAWHYVGPFGDPIELGSLAFRWVCGLVFIAIYEYRGFAPAVWCHTLYDLWVTVG